MMTKMTWKKFFDTIKESGLLGNTSTPQIIIDLFRAAGNMSEFSTSAAQSWIDNKRICKASKYFPDNKLNNVSGALKFFRNRPEGKLKGLQQLFREADCDSPIDLETNDMNIFCKSLVNQFLDFLGFERLDMPDRATSSLNNESMCDIPTSCNHDTETLRNMITESNENAETDMFPQESPDSSAQIAIPKECYVCLCCKSWKGNVKDALENEEGVYGKCLLYQKETLSSSKKICAKFNPAYDRITVSTFKQGFL